ncbi:hypothetical protein Dxin01_04160 [Deinococcus xinjiangensis]|uniref:Uncharacterized protein n=1 Tax=Deinococcus xinjiangensis TaxID=457454 RepID=A0ABP9VGP7_9DEIO
MTSSFRSERVEHLAVAQVLLGEPTRTALAAFLTPRSLSEAARWLDKPLNTVKYQWQKLLKLGLLQPVDPQSTDFRHTRRYLARATSYFIPYELTPAEWPQEILELLHRDWETQLNKGLIRASQTALRERGLWGVQVVQSGSELLLEHAVWSAGDWNFTRPDAPAVLDLLTELQLDYADAKALQDELLKLISRYRKKGGSQVYLLRLGLTPVAGA